MSINMTKTEELKRMRMVMILFSKKQWQDLMLIP